MSKRQQNASGSESTPASIENIRKAAKEVQKPMKKRTAQPTAAKSGLFGKKRHRRGWCSL